MFPAAGQSIDICSRTIRATSRRLFRCHRRETTANAVLVKNRFQTACQTGVLVPHRFEFGFACLCLLANIEASFFPALPRPAPLRPDPPRPVDVRVLDSTGKYEHKRAVQITGSSKLQVIQNYTFINEQFKLQGVQIELYAHFRSVHIFDKQRAQLIRRKSDRSLYYRIALESLLLFPDRTGRKGFTETKTRRSTGQQPGRKSACGPVDKQVINRLSTAGQPRVNR